MFFGILTASGACAGVLLTLILALLGRPHAAVLVLGSGMVAMGVLRSVWPGRPWFSARSVWSDACVYALVGAALLWLSPWTSVLSV